jgi:hypothetical protein
MPNLFLQSNMITPPGLTVPTSEDKNIHITEKAGKPIVGLWRVGSKASWSDESEAQSTSSNINLRTEKGAIDAHVVVTSYARDDRPQVDVSTTTGPITIRMVSVLLDTRLSLPESDQRSGTLDSN